MSLLSLHGISARFGGIVALDEVSFSVAAGTIHGLIGPNGAGKTTLINIISGLAPASSGRLHFADRDDGPWPMARAVRLGIARTFQQTRVFPGLTVRENLRVAEVAGACRGGGDALLAAFGLEPVLDRIAGELTYAVLRRLGVALALALRPKLLLLDEPAVGLTHDEVAAMGEVIRRCNGAGVTVLLVEHNVRFLMSLADRVSVLDRGRLLFEGTPAECQNNRAVIDVYLGRGIADADA